MKCPLDQGFRMPAEWEPHDATWISWPHNPETWPGKHESIFSVWPKMIEALQNGEKVHINVNDQKMEEAASSLLASFKLPLQNIFFHHIPTNDCWMRDCGPIFVVHKPPSPQPSPIKGEGDKYDFLSPGGRGLGRGGIAIIDWEFNMWGGKYPPWDKDNALPKRIADDIKVKRFETGIVLEGGSIDVNGMGTLLTTKSCLLNKNRNPKLSKEQIEDCLRNYLGVIQILWLGDGIAGDDTDGHVDDIARFVRRDTVVAAVEENPSDKNYKPLKENVRRLGHMRDQDGQKINIVPIPMPQPVFHEGHRLPASYANFYIANSVVLVPTFNDPNDDKALKILSDLFPTRKMVGIHAADLVWGFGAFHCITQQQPSV